MLDFLRTRSAEARMTMPVCSGSGLLAMAGVLDGRRATSNKQFFSLITGQASGVEWVKAARWVEDGDLMTSSGVPAGMDWRLPRSHGSSVSSEGRARVVGRVAQEGNDARDKPKCWQGDVCLPSVDAFGKGADLEMDA